MRAAFTLIELLVVIAIVSLLVGLLLPTLGGARDAARTAACLSQLRTIGQFTMMYADQHDEEMPRSQHSSFPNKVAPWGYAFYEYVTGDAYVNGDNAWSTVFNGLYRCPMDRREERWSYGYNVYYELTAYETGDHTWRRLSSPARPQATVLFGELNDLTTADHAMAHYWVQYESPPEIDALRHRDSTGAAFLDGHASTQRFGDLFDIETEIDAFNPATAR